MSTITVSKKRYEELLRNAGIEPMAPQQANKEVAEKVAQVKVLLKEIKEIVEISGIDVRLGGSYGSLAGAIEEVDELHSEWNTSSYDC
jgi:hypothetical protein